MAFVKNTVQYFAYGSNMFTRRLAARVHDAAPLSSGVLHGHELRFHKSSRDGSGKCDAYQVDHGDAQVIGALFNLPRTGKAELDRIEDEVQKVETPASYAEELYHLRLHVELVRRKLEAYVTEQTQDGLRADYSYNKGQLASR